MTHFAVSLLRCDRGEATKKSKIMSASSYEKITWFCTQSTLLSFNGLVTNIAATLASFDVKHKKKAKENMNMFNKSSFIC